MNIGIITYHASHNYGAMLQAFALQQYLIKLNLGSVKIIDYRPVGGANPKKILPRPISFKQFIWYFITLYYYKALKKKMVSFEFFLQEYMDKTMIYTSFEDLLNSPPNFDIYITGSDQTFSPNSKFIDAFYLAFCPEKKKRIAYAPSFGFNTISNGKIDKIRTLLEKYDFLSAREIGGCNLIESILHKKVPSVLDPVFLLKPEEWQAIAKPLKIKYSSFILCYALIGSKDQMEIANRLKKHTGLPVVLMTHSIFPRTNADVTINSAGPLEFIWLYEKAKYIVTDSFHGTAFSIIFRKPFFSFIAYKEKSERIVGLLKKVGLENRIIEKPCQVTEETLDIAYAIPIQKLTAERRISANYLISSING